MSEFYLNYEYHISSTQLIFAMIGMGATVSPSDFMDVLRFPKGFALGMFSVLVLSPCLALIVGVGFDLEPGLATGLVLVASVPGGTMSNILTYFAKANVPLSISLTAVATTVCLVTTPLILRLFAGTMIGADFQMPGGRINLEIGCFLLLPLAVGIAVGHYADEKRQVLAKVFIRLSLAVIILIVVGAASADRIDAGAYGGKIVAAMACFSLLLYAGGFGLLKVAGLPTGDAIAAAIETGFRNMSLALLIKASLWPIQAGVPDPFADQIFFVALLYGGLAMVFGLIPVFAHRRLAVDI
jgi:BASS family bile acid:Na+ symporter